jgi:hypothetical protein
VAVQWKRCSGNVSEIGTQLFAHAARLAQVERALGLEPPPAADDAASCWSCAVPARERERARIGRPVIRPAQAQVRQQPQPHSERDYPTRRLDTDEMPMPDDLQEGSILD